jgi:hypothetical protein
VNGSGAVIAGLLTLSVGVGFAARSSGSTELANLLTGIIMGPTLFFPAAVFLAAGSVVVIRTPTVPSYSAVTARVFLLLALAYGAGAGLQLFQNYAWINDTAGVTFLVAIAIISVIGIIRWGDMDATTPQVRRAAGSRPVSEPADETPVRKARPRTRKAAPRKRSPG